MAGSHRDGVRRCPDVDLWRCAAVSSSSSSGQGMCTSARLQHLYNNMQTRVSTEQIENKNKIKKASQMREVSDYKTHYIDFFCFFITDCTVRFK